jgi:serine/threonine protein kinase/DNA-binding beta-propeller fold protein YncE
MADVAIGSVFAGYRIEGVAGEGGMGRVYRATQMALDRLVALKVIMPELAGDADFRTRFEREAHLSASIDHPNVIPVYEAGEADGRLFIAMRWVEGTDLRSLIASEERLDPSRVVAIVEQIGEALDAAHSGGLVHRDVKPANVMLTATHGREHAYLTDFGLTKKTASTTALTRTGRFVGTPDYMPPEQISGERADARADVYALGCLLFHALTGRPPYERDSEVAKIYAHLHDPPPSAVETAPGTPAGLDAVITRALAKNADQRYPSAGDLGRAARAALTGAIPSQQERSLATGLAAPEATHIAAPPTVPSVQPTAPGAQPTAPSAPPTELSPAQTAPAPVPAEPPPPAGPAPPSGPPPSERPGRRGVPVAMAAVLALGALGGGLAATGVLSGDSRKERSSTGARSTTAPSVVATIPAGNGPDGIAVDGHTVWVSNSDGNSLTRLDTRSNKAVGGPVPVGRNPDNVAAANGVVWVANTDDGTVTRLQADLAPGTSRIVPVGAGPEGLSLGKRFVWVANGDGDSVSRIDRASATTAGSPIAVGNKPIGLFVGEESVWVTNSFSRTVTRIDPSSATVVGQPVRVGKNIRSVTEGLGYTWVSSVDEDTVTRLDPKSGTVVGAPITVGDRPKEMASAGGLLWVVNEGGNSVSRIDPKAGKVVGSPIRVGKTPVGIAAGAGSVWVTNNASDTVTRIDP